MEPLPVILNCFNFPYEWTGIDGLIESNTLFHRQECYNTHSKNIRKKSINFDDLNLRLQ